MHLFCSRTDTNAFLGRGQMFVLSTEQLRQLLETDFVGGDMLDIGAGDGNTTCKLAPLFDAVFTTEVSDPMTRVLNQRGLNCTKSADLSVFEEHQFRFIR